MPYSTTGMRVLRAYPECFTTFFAKNVISKIESDFMKNSIFDGNGLLKKVLLVCLVIAACIMLVAFVAFIDLSPDVSAAETFFEDHPYEQNYVGYCPDDHVLVDEFCYPFTDIGRCVDPWKEIDSGGCYNSSSPVSPLVCDPETEVEIDGLCYPITGSATCGDGYTMIDGLCYPIAGPATCGDGYTMIDGLCYQIAAASCGDGYTMIDGLCYPIAGSATCGDGYTMIDGLCYPIADSATCGDGYTMIDGLCYQTLTSRVYPAGYI